MFTGPLETRDSTLKDHFEQSRASTKRNIKEDFHGEPLLLSYFRCILQCFCDCAFRSPTASSLLKVAICLDFSAVYCFFLLIRFDRDIHSDNVPIRKEVSLLLKGCGA